MAAIALAAVAACSNGAAEGSPVRSIAAFPQRRFGAPHGSPSGLSLWTTEERIALFDLADTLGIPVDSLGTVMAIESGFNPAAINPGLTRAAGLIQLTLGANLPHFVTPNDIAQVAKWDVKKQLRDVVAVYYSRVQRAKGADAGTLYMLNLLPAHAFEAAETVIARKLDPEALAAIAATASLLRTPEQKNAMRQHFIYTQNSGFDTHHRGFFTVGDVKSFAFNVLASAHGRRMTADGTIILPA